MQWSRTLNFLDLPLVVLDFSPRVKRATRRSLCNRITSAASKNDSIHSKVPDKVVDTAAFC